jgi:hypothetical protein
MEKKIVNYTSNMGLISKMYKELRTLTSVVLAHSAHKSSKNI